MEITIKLDPAEIDLAGVLSLLAEKVMALVDRGEVTKAEKRKADTDNVAKRDAAYYRGRRAAMAGKGMAEEGVAYRRGWESVMRGNATESQRNATKTQRNATPPQQAATPPQQAATMAEVLENKGVEGGSATIATPQNATVAPQNATESQRNATVAPHNATHTRDVCVLNNINNIKNTHTTQSTATPPQQTATQKSVAWRKPWKGRGKSPPTREKATPVGQLPIPVGLPKNLATPELQAAWEKYHRWRIANGGSMARTEAILTTLAATVEMAGVEQAIRTLEWNQQERIINALWQPPAIRRRKLETYERRELRKQAWRNVGYRGEVWTQGGDPLDSTREKYPQKEESFREEYEKLKRQAERCEE